MGDGNSFRIDTRRESGQVRIVPHGELDLGTASRLDDELRSLESEGFERMVLDLSELELMGSSGLGVIFAAHQRCEETETSFLLVRGPAHVQRIFEVTDLVSRFRFLDEEPG